jgi:glycerate dehydrogenase
MAMKAVFLDYSTLGPGLDTSPLTDLIPDFQFFDATGNEQVAGRIGDAEFVIANKVRLDDELMERASKLQFIGLTATGTDNIDLDGARRRGIAVCNIRGYCTQSVTEHVFGVLLMLTHSLHRYTAAVRQGKWQQAKVFCMHDYPVRELSSMTMGIVGHGELGRSVANRARDFGMNVLISGRPGTGAVPGDRVPFNEVLERSDVISLHCPLSEETGRLFSTAEFQHMKASSVLINTARGALVDSSALVSALGSGEIAAAAIDVLSDEPPVNGDPLLDYEGANLIVTPHVAWSSEQARQGAVSQLAANIAAFLDGGERNRVV